MSFGGAENILDERMSLIIKKMISNSYISFEQLLKETVLSKRQLDYSVKKINTWLESNKQPLIKCSSTEGIQIPKVTRKFLIDNMDREKELNGNYIYSKQERMICVFLMLCSHNKEGYLSLEHIIQLLKVSKSSVLTDIRQVKEQLIHEGIEVMYDRQKGYYLKGAEWKIRYKMMRDAISLLRQENGEQILNYLIEYFQLGNRKKIKNRVVILMRKYNIHFYESNLDEFVFCFILLINRLKSIEIPEVSRQIENTLKHSKEYDFTKELLKEMNLDNESNKLFVSSWIVGLSVGNYYENTPDRELILNLVHNILIRFEALSGTKVYNDTDFLKQIYQHFRPTYYRLLFGLPIINPMLEIIKEEYKDMYVLVRETMKPFKVLFDEDIPEDEIAFITIHFASAIRNHIEYRTKRKKAVLICPNGTGTSAILYKELQELLTDIEFLPPISNQELEQLTMEYDIIFSTQVTPQLFSQNKPCYIVSPIMTQSEKYKILKEVASDEKDIDNGDKRAMKDIMTLIKKYATVNDETLLKTELSYYLTTVANIENTNNRNTSPRLSEIINVDMIQLNVQADDCESAIRKCAMPLLKYGKVNAQYIEQMVQNTKELGGYIVITKNVALPHARPIKGVNKMAISIATLEHPLEFGNDKNDPVKYVFCLSAESGTEHLNAMAELVDLLEMKEFYYVLDNSREAKDIYDYIVLCENGKEIQGNEKSTYCM